MYFKLILNVSEQKQTSHRSDDIVPLNSGNCLKNLPTGFFFAIVVSIESGHTIINMVGKSKRLH